MSELQGCQFYGSIIACYTRHWDYRTVRNCPTCKRRTRHVMRLEGYYGHTVGCVACGDAWMDGELCPRPTKRGWRKEARAKWKQHWDEAMTKAAAHAAERAWLFPDDEDE